VTLGQFVGFFRNRREESRPGGGPAIQVAPEGVTLAQFQGFHRPTGMDSQRQPDLPRKDPPPAGKAVMKALE
jgi:hypothetical protein